MFPGKNLLWMMRLGVNFYTIRTERFKAVDIGTEVGDFFSRVFIALQP